MLSTNPTLLSSLPENVLFNIAGYLNPPDVYLFNQLFPEVTQPVATLLSGRNFLTLNDPETQYYQQTPGPEVVHTVNAATNLSIYDCCMRESQARSLVRVLNITSPSVFTLEKTKQLTAAMRNINNPRQGSPRHPNAKILLSGSVSLQAVLGRIFYTKGRTTSDVDLFVSRDALPEVREAMVALDLHCHQVSNRYGVSAFGPQLIDHIECYVIDQDPNGDQAPYVTASSLAKDHRRRMGRNLRPGISYKNRLRNKAVHGVGIVRPGHEDEDFYRFPVDYPFTLDADFRNRKVVEVIVAKDGYSPEELIANFDIEACKVYFDGEKFGNVNDMIYLNMSDWNRNWDPWINHYIPLCIPQVYDISRRTSPKDPIDKAKLFLEDNFFESDDHKLLWMMNAFSETHLSNNHCKIPCLEHGFNNCECTLVSQTSSRFFDTFHHKVVKQFLRGLKYIDRGINIHISTRLIEAFLGEAAVRKLARSKAKTTLIARYLKKVKRERDGERIHEKRAKMSPAEKAEVNAEAREVTAQKRAKMTPEQGNRVRACDKDTTARKRERTTMSPAERAEANAKAREATPQKRVKKGAKMPPPDLVEAWLINMKTKAHKTTEKSSAKKPEPMKVTPEKSAKLSPEERKELCRAKRRLALTEETDANSVKAKTRKTKTTPRQEIRALPLPDYMSTSVLDPRSQR